MENSLVECVACKNMISSEARQCPRCGQITPYGKQLQRREEEKREEERRAQQRKEQAKAYSITALVAGIFGIVGLILAGHGLFTMMGDINDYRNGWGYSYQGNLTSHEQGVIFELIFGTILWLTMMFISRSIQKKAKEVEQNNNKPFTFSTLSDETSLHIEKTVVKSENNEKVTDPTKLKATVVPPDNVKKAMLYVVENINDFKNTTEIKEYFNNTLGTIDKLEPSVVEMLDKRIKAERVYGSLRIDTKNEIESYLNSIQNVQEVTNTEEKVDDSWDDLWDHPASEPKRVINGEVYDALQYILEHSNEFKNAGDIKKYLIRLGNIKEKTEPELRMLVDKRINDEKGTGITTNEIITDLTNYLNDVTKE